jgi:multicomponent Na+:H+ antiporter subunit D
MPWTMAAFAIASISMIGLPPTAGFISKWYILQGALEVGQNFAVGVIILSTLLNAGYFLPIVYAAFLRPPDQPAGGNPGDHEGEHEGGNGHHDHGEAPLPVVVALTLTAAGTLALFWFPDVPLALARNLIGGGL